MTDLTTRPVPERQEPDSPPDLADRREQPGDDAPPFVPGGVGLNRLLALARLTSAQALEIGAGVLAAAAGEATPGSGGPNGGVLVVDPVVAADGQVVLRPTTNGGRGSPSRRPANEVLADVVAAVPLPGPVAEPDQRLAELDRAVQDLPTAGLPIVARRLQEAAAANDRTAVRAELAALVRAAGGARGAGGSMRGDPETGEQVSAAPMQSAPWSGRSAGRRIGAWLLSILVLAAVVVTEVILLRDDVTADIGLLLDAGRDGDQPSDAPEPAGPQLPLPAPAAAGNVAAVDLRPLAPCAPGAPCTVSLGVRLVPSTEPQVVTWTYQVFERCKGPSVMAPGGTVTVPPQADRAAALSTVALPALDGVAVFAVTDAPAVAASAPMVVGSCESAGQDG